MKKLSLLDWIFMVILAISIAFLFSDNDYLELISKIGIAVSLVFLVIRNIIEYWRTFIKKK